MTEPMTEAGRALIAAYPGNAADASSPEFIRYHARRIIAIEREAIDAFLASPEAVEEVREAMRRWLFLGLAEAPGGLPEASAAFLAALRDLRGAK